MFEYETLKLIWWVFVGVLLIGFAIMDGFDLGIGALLPFLGKSNEERRVMINTIGPTWEGNQVWLVTAGGALFAAWPMVYAASFSGFYLALMLVLFALILRPVGFDYRSKVESTRWRKLWDNCLFIGGAVPALVFGIAFGNLLLGVPFYFDDEMHIIYTGSFFALLNPFSLLAGLVSLSMLIMHGGTFLQLRTEGALQQRARRASYMGAVAYVMTFIIAGAWIGIFVEGYTITAMPDPNTAFVPAAKTVTTAAGGWLVNYNLYPWSIAAPVSGICGALLSTLCARLNLSLLAFICSAVTVAATILTAGLAMFPFVMPSSTHPGHSLTLWDAVSSHYTLQLMFWAVVIFLPIVMAYTSWVYVVMRGKVTEQTIRENTHTAY